MNNCKNCQVIITEGDFCSPKCRIAFVRDQKRKREYKIYKEFYNRMSDNASKVGMNLDELIEWIEKIIPD